jgi:aminotransferase
MASGYQICNRCVMDTSDHMITFDEQGVCMYCQNFDNVTSKKWFKGEEGQKQLDAIVAQIKANGKGKEYDCILGLSGGVDSAYLAYLGNQLGLRMLAVHVDAGWNSELAVQNIQNICLKLNIDLVTEVIDWGVMRKLQLAFLKSGIINQDIPQDHAFFAALYKYAIKNNIKYVLNGSNIATENTLPIAFAGPAAMDDALVKSIYKTYTGEKLKNYPTLNFWYFNFLNAILKRFEVVKPLNYIDYSKDSALEILKEKVDFNDYGEKHNESRFTKWHQNYFLVKKYGIEKRRAHLASVVISGLMSRDEALEILKKPTYKTALDEKMDIEYIIKKLGISQSEFDAIMSQSPKTEYDFNSSKVKYLKVEPFIKGVGKIFRKLGIIK